MTISSTTRVNGPYVSGTALPVTFKVFAAADLEVVRLNTSTGVETSLVLGSDYTVALNGNQNTNPGGTVNLTVAASATSTVTITSDIANLQPTDLTNQGGFYPEVITDALDRATIQIQQMSEDVGRSLKGPISDGSLNMELPTAAQRANSFLAFDANGVPTAVVSGSSGAPTTITRQVFSGTGSQTVFTLASDPGALGNSAQIYIGGVYQQRSTYTIAGTTLTFSQAPVAGTDNIEFVNFLTSNIGATSADLVTYTPSGTGAVARSAASKMGDVVSVKDFGAVGDGVANDTAAIEAAIAVCKGGAGKPALYFPAGTYNFSESVANFGLYINAAIKIVGDGPTRTILKNTSATGAGIRCASGFITISDLTLDQNGSTGIGFRCPGQYGVVRNVQITNQAGSNYAFVADGATLVQIDSLHILNATNGISIAPTTATQYLTFTHCSVEFTQRGLTAGISSGMTFTELYFEPVNGTTSFVHVMEVSNSLNYQFFGLNMELFGLPSNANVAAIIFSNCRNFNIFGSKVFENQANMTNAQLVRVDGASTRSINFTGMDFQTSSTGLTLFRVQNNPYQITWRNIRANGNPAGTGIDYTGSSGNGLNVENWTSSNAAFNLKLRSNDMYVNCADANTGIEFLGSDTNMSVINCRGALSGTGVSNITQLDNVICVTGGLRPKSDGVMNLGSAGNRWNTLFATNPTINTSDSRQKTDIRTLTAQEIATAQELRGLLRAYRFRSAVDLKGDDARIHVGIIAQDVEASFTRNGLDASRYGMFCRDAVVDPVTNETVNQLGVRYSELYAFILAAT